LPGSNKLLQAAGRKQRNFSWRSLRNLVKRDSHAINDLQLRSAITIPETTLLTAKRLPLWIAVLVFTEAFIYSWSVWTATLAKSSFLLLNMRTF
jgi:hypothetical protein